MVDGRTISPQDLGLASAPVVNAVNSFDDYIDLPLTEAKTRLVEDFERAAITRAIEIESAT